MSTIIKGDVLEGGGQILRIAVAMSAITGRSISIENIRAGRKKPGLAAQHLTGILLAKDMSNGKVENAALGSTAVKFYPSRLTGGSFIADTKTAGSVALLLQVALPCGLFSEEASTLTLKGGTDAEMAPPISYTLRVFKPILEKFGADFSGEIKRRGFFPAGNGEVLFEIAPLKKLMPVNLTDFGEINVIEIEAYWAGNHNSQISARMAKSAENELKSKFPSKIECKKTLLTKNEAFGNGCGLIVIAKTTTRCILGASAIGRKTVSPEDLGRTVAEEITKDLARNACVDQYLQDQLILPMALASGTSVIRTGPITLHTQTAIHVISMMCDAKFRIEKDGDCNLIECDGIGFVSNFQA